MTFSSVYTYLFIGIFAMKKQLNFNKNCVPYRKLDEELKKYRFKALKFVNFCNVNKYEKYYTRRLFSCKYLYINYINSNFITFSMFYLLDLTKFISNTFLQGFMFF